mmetsp:Transcript_26579/g.58486  ORF Transcript_26579/g.58486 Transcript_26579/m.58486 type:complete len:221 (+) Transcript_26579:2165-2827(+)
MLLHPLGREGSVGFLLRQAVLSEVRREYLRGELDVIVRPLLADLVGLPHPHGVPGDYPGVRSHKDRHADLVVPADLYVPLLGGPLVDSLVGKVSHTPPLHPVRRRLVLLLVLFGGSGGGGFPLWLVAVAAFYASLCAPEVVEEPPLPCFLFATSAFGSAPFLGIEGSDCHLSPVVVFSRVREDHHPRIVVDAEAVPAQVGRWQNIGGHLVVEVRVAVQDW